MSDFSPAKSGLQPNTVFREYTYNYAQVPGTHFSELDPGCKREFEEGSAFHNKPRRVPKALELDLEGSIRAEMCVEYWGGHIGTSGQSFSANDHAWIPIPQPVNMPTEPECYYRTLLGNAAVPIPLEHLQHGVNHFKFTCGEQIKYGFDWGMFWIYSFTVRVYYSASKPHPSGTISVVQPEYDVAGHPEFVLDTTQPNAIKTVDFIANYKDFDWEGDGLFLGWHYHTRYGIMHQNINTATAAPYKVSWNTDWVPDQDQPVKVMARVCDEDGVCATTPSIEFVLTERSHSVKMYASSDVPENFGVRVGRRMTCTINIPNEVTDVKEAQLVLSTWSAIHANAIGLNDTQLMERVGYEHDYSIDVIPVPPSILRQGENTFFIYAITEHHAAEINWPGPVLLLKRYV